MKQSINRRLVATGNASKTNHGETSLQVKSQKGSGNQKRGPSEQETNALIALSREERYADAAAFAKTLTVRYPADGFGWRGLGWAYRQMGRPLDAVAAWQKATTVSPGDVESLINLGACFEVLDRLDEAEETYQSVLQLKPQSAVAWFNLGNVLKRAGRQDEAKAGYEQALRLQPSYAKALYNLAGVFFDQGWFAEAEAGFRAVLRHQPAWPQAHFNLGNALRELDRLEEAEACFKRALAIEPEVVSSNRNLGLTLQNLGRLEEAEACFRRALEVEPNNTDVCSNLLFMLNYTHHSASLCLDEARRYGRMAAEQVGTRFATWQCEKSPRRLRVGLVSGDFREHPVSHFLESVLSNIDPSRIELYAYPNHTTVDEVTERIKGRCAAWKTLLGKTDEAAARLIHGDSVHVLIDLSGHTAHNRLPVFAWRPAPVQVSWLGYFATTGVAEIDYLIADPLTLPETDESCFTERIWRLPETRLCFTAPDVAVPVAPLPAVANAYVTFACFNNLTKMNDAVVALWARVLAAVPNSRLFLKTRQLKEQSIAQKVIERFAAHGVSADRLILEGLTPRADYLLAYHRADIALDPFPFTGGTTTAESLWMGVPVLTLAGDRFISRQGVGLLMNAGLTEWIAADEDDYVRRAVAHARDIDDLAALRHGLRQQVLASPIFDAPRFARHLDAALHGMWDEWLAQLPAGDDEAAWQAPSDTIEIICATRYSEQDFWQKSALGISLERLKHEHRLVARIAYENQRGLPEVYNERILAADSSETLIFIHDDVWLDDCFLADRVREGLASYDVIGVAGNKRREPAQPGWAFIDEKFNWYGKARLSGALAHGPTPCGPISVYGHMPAACELLDGVFLAVRKSALTNSGVLFDPRFDFHFYDMDFCRTARQSGLRLGTWPLALTHQSIGAFGTIPWKNMFNAYLNKWEK
jgi:predicted O-linked N-acetylglucosamine transferase (SPINDLY family)